MAVKEKPECEEMEWSTEEEIQLYLAMVGLKPIGINKHINMACICKRLSSALKRDIQPEIVWAHLHTMFNLEALDQMEPLPLPQEQREFSIPESEFSSLISKKLQEEEERSDSGTKSKSTTPQPQTSSTKNTTPIVQKSNQSLITPKPSSTSTSNKSQSNASKPSSQSATGKTQLSAIKLELDKSRASQANDTPKRGAKRTRGSISNESNSPSTTPPPTHMKRRRI